MTNRDKPIPQTLPVPVETPAEPKPSRASRAGAGVSFFAQVLGQPGRKRGLKGGQPVLDEARSTYLETEWSGPNDRRVRPGKITKTEV